MRVVTGSEHVRHHHETASAEAHCFAVEDVPGEFDDVGVIAVVAVARLNDFAFMVAVVASGAGLEFVCAHRVADVELVCVREFHDLAFLC